MPKQHIVKSVFWLTISEIIYNISGYIIHSGVGRILGPADYGRYGLVITLTTMIIILIGNGVPTAMSKFLSEHFESNPKMILVIKNKALLLQSVLIGIITIAFFLLAPFTARALGDESLTPLFRISTLIIPSFAAASFYFYYFTGIHRFNIQAILKTVRSLSRMIFILALAWFLKVEGSILGYVLAPFFVFLIAFGIDRFSIAPRIKKQIRESKAKAIDFPWQKLADYAWPMTLFMLFYEIMISIDLYMVKSIVADDFSTGIYNGALTVSRIPYFLFYALTIVLLPTISKTTSENNTKETQKVMSQTLRIMLILLFPIVALMSSFSTPIISFFYGTNYSAAANPMQILVLGMSFLTIFYVLSFALNGAGKVKTTMSIALLGMISNIILNYCFISKFGLMGAATATSITSFFVMILGIYYTKKEFGVSPKLFSTLKILTSSCMILFISSLFPESNFMFILYSIALIGLYFIILYFLKELGKNDLDLIKKIAQKNKK
jgi:stage V sporulation protein B